MSIFTQINLWLGWTVGSYITYLMYLLDKHLVAVDVGSYFADGKMKVRSLAFSFFFLTFKSANSRLCCGSILSQQTVIVTIISSL